MRGRQSPALLVVTIWMAPRARAALRLQRDHLAAVRVVVGGQLDLEVAVGAALEVLEVLLGVLGACVLSEGGLVCHGVLLVDLVGVVRQPGADS